MVEAIVIGMARSGVGAANLLRSTGAGVTVTDSRGEDALRAELACLSPGIKLALGGHPDSLLDGAGMLVVSPGVPMSIPFIKKAIALKVEVVGELELAWRHAQGKPFYAVTGTNGKSTAVTLLHKMMVAAGRRALLGGNIGNSLCDEFHMLTPDGVAKLECVVAEVSSFQLESISRFRAHGATVLNVTPDHLDRYHSIDEYRATKERVSLNQSDGDFLVLNADDQLTASMKTGGRALYFSRTKKVEGAYLAGDMLRYEIGGSAGDIVRASEMGIHGVHNVENALAASAMAIATGCPVDAVARVLREFKGLEHRLEFVRELDGVKYINDSKGTNVGAVLKSLASFDTPVVLIAGGRDKAGQFGELVPLVKERCRAVVLIGEAAGKIRKAVGESAPCSDAGSMAEAVSVARSLASKGDVVLLSPACASFDMFRNFEDRGRKFKEAVRAL